MTPNDPDRIQSSPGNPYVIVFDGGSIGNPGKGYGSFLLYSPIGQERHRELDFSDISEEMTNNQAEYRSLIAALRELGSLLGTRVASEHVRVEGDSQLVLNQLDGRWTVKNAELKLLHRQASDLVDQFASVDFRWHARDRSVKLLGH